jgi:hypothetical protein
MAANGVNTVANYIIEYAMTELDTSDEVDELFDFLTTTYAAEIKNQTINGSSIDEEFVDDYSQQLNTTISKTWLSFTPLCKLITCVFSDTIGNNIFHFEYN